MREEDKKLINRIEVESRLEIEQKPCDTKKLLRERKENNNATKEDIYHAYIMPYHVMTHEMCKIRRRIIHLSIHWNQEKKRICF